MGISRLENVKKKTRYYQNEEKGSKKSGRKRMKKEFSIQFFRPPHLPLNEQQVHKIFFSINSLPTKKKEGDISCRRISFSEKVRRP